MAIVTSENDLKNLRISGKILTSALEEVASKVQPGVTTSFLDAIAEKETRKNGAKPAFKGYQPQGAATPFPASICISVNDEVVHGIPSEKKLYEGDIVSLDFGVNYEGMFTDCAITMPVGTIDQRTQKLLKTTYNSLMSGIKQVKAGNFTGDIGNAVEGVGTNANYGIIRELIGHGVGYAVHEDPQVPNFGKPKTGSELVENLVIAIEPMFTDGSPEVQLAHDHWTFVSADESLSAHFEQTVRTTKEGSEIITPYSKKLLQYAHLID